MIIRLFPSPWAKKAEGRPREKVGEATPKGQNPKLYKYIQNLLLLWSLVSCGHILKLIQIEWKGRKESSFPLPTHSSGNIVDTGKRWRKKERVFSQVLVRFQTCRSSRRLTSRGQDFILFLWKLNRLWESEKNQKMMFVAYGCCTRGCCTSLSRHLGLW